MTPWTGPVHGQTNPSCSNSQNHQELTVLRQQELPPFLLVQCSHCFLVCQQFIQQRVRIFRASTSTHSHTLTHSHPHSDTNNGVKQMAALCLLRLLRVNPRLIPIDQHAARIVQLLNDRHFGVVTSAYSLLEELAHINSVGFMDCVSMAVY